jgi:hypothetical protein
METYQLKNNAPKEFLFLGAFDIFIYVKNNSSYERSDLNIIVG